VEHGRLRREKDEARADELMQRELNRRKDEFLTIVAHELKTPLTSLQGYIQLMARRFATSARHPDGENEFARKVVSHEEESVQRIIRLVDDLLEGSCIRSGQLALRVERCELCTLVRGVVEEHRLLQPDRHIQLTLPNAPTFVLADVLRIRQVVTIYLVNALKYSREDQPIEVSLGMDGALAFVAVHDHGPGVPASQQAHIWELYYRAEGVEVQTGSTVGLGVGLYLSKMLITAQHGQVGVDSTLGKGSTFWFTLPLAE
jgi:signal transduction histidine kinase